MLSDSLGTVLDVAEGSVESGGGSIATLFAAGSSNVSTLVARMLDALATGSGNPPAAGK
ncbi:hypothetical protein [Dietzia maris]|uniref:hypothetical protein n=1 Tax=Dietzia maris TaxID=37915 RepID=UPI00223B0490|nr:hypothetical protein [Dietzia maris]MCT1434178.1 hypothetical protein [Dietzia maris]MCT1521395.1 hypothetical protein [Dietzia maris]